MCLELINIFTAIHTKHISILQILSQLNVFQRLTSFVADKIEIVHRVYT